MEVLGKVAVVTGGAGGIGGAIAERLASSGARVAVVDLDGAGVGAVAKRIDERLPGSAVAIAADAASSTEIARVVSEAERRFGPVDLYFANAGVLGESGLGESEAGWERALDVNLLAHVRAAELLIPQWLERGQGYFISTASAAGLLTQIGLAQYSVSKHAAVAFAEWLSVTYGERGIAVSCICPMGVDTAMLRGGLETTDPLGSLATDAVISAGAVLTSAQVAEVVVEALRKERFLILPHPEVLQMLSGKGNDYDHWLHGMRRYQARLLQEPGRARREAMETPPAT